MLTIDKALHTVSPKRKIDQGKFADFKKKYLAFYSSLKSSDNEEQLKAKLSSFFGNLFPKETVAPYTNRFFARVDLALGHSDEEPIVIIETKAMDASDMVQGGGTERIK